MTFKYYLKNIVLGLIPVVVALQGWLTDHSDKSLLILLVSMLSCLLLPFSRKMTEIICLKFTSKEFWNRDFFTSSVGGSLQAILFLFCFVFAIPISVMFLIFLIKKRLAKKKWPSA